MFEEVAPKRTGAFRDVFLIIICGFALLSLPNWVSALFAFPYVKAIYEFLVFLGIGLLIFRFLRSYGTEYKYSLVDSVLTIRSKIGARETIVAQIYLSAESELIPLSEANELIRKNQWKKRRITFGVADKKMAYLLTFPIQNGNSALIFQPSDKFVKILKQLPLDKQEKM